MICSPVRIDGALTHSEQAALGSTNRRSLAQASLNDAQHKPLEAPRAIDVKAVTSSVRRRGRTREDTRSTRLEVPSHLRKYWVHIQRMSVPIHCVYMSETTLLNTGIYSLNQASRLIGAEPRAVGRWMRGHKWKYRGGYQTTPPLWKTQLADAEFDTPAIGFRDLMELRFVRAFIAAGVSLHVIKATIEEARESFHTDYPLTTRKFQTDGRKIFESVFNEHGDETLTDVRAHQIVFVHVIKPSLYAGIEYDGNVATLWSPQHSKGVALDPARQFGAPIVVDAGIATDTLFDAFIAEGRDRKAVARQFDVDPRHVDVAVRFEERLRA